MQSAEYDRNTIILSSRDETIKFRASGSVLKFDGFLKLYEGIDNKDDADKILPEVKNKETVNIDKIVEAQHFTEPPPRYSEASLVKKLEELGIGRPSTYASIISVLSTRNYVDLINKRFHPTDRGKLLAAFLEKLFSKYVDYNFTADLEDQLDEITSGKIKWLGVLEKFWKDFNENVQSVKEKRTREVLDLLNESLGELIFDTTQDGKIDRKCPLCSVGELSLKNSFRGGAFIGCSNYPECKFTRPLSKSKAAESNALSEPKLIGLNSNGKEIILKSGRFGPYLQYELLVEENIVKKIKSQKKLRIKILKMCLYPKEFRLIQLIWIKQNFYAHFQKFLGNILIQEKILA
jgi:DNA topoisomerase-1